MRLNFLAPLILLLIICKLSPATPQIETNPDSPTLKAAVALLEMIKNEGNDSLLSFMNRNIGPPLTNTHTEKSLMDLLRNIRKDFRTSHFEGAIPKGAYISIMMFTTLEGTDPSRLTFEIEARPPHRFVYIDY